jgi:hypothetical protein
MPVSHSRGRGIFGPPGAATELPTAWECACLHRRRWSIRSMVGRIDEAKARKEFFGVALGIG